MTPPLVCVTVTAPTTAELRARRDAVPDADLIELRVDSVADPDLRVLLEGRARPVIVTCRPTWEGGRFEGAEETRKRLLLDALTLGAEFVDVEWRAGFTELLSAAGGRRIVLSSHDFEGVPADLLERARAMHATGAEVIKIAVKANSLADCTRLLDVSAVLGADQKKVLIGMGEAGVVTRILAGRFESAWTYAGSLSSVGQVTPRELLDVYRFRTLNAKTSIYGLIGSPIGHSVSPAMHNAAIRAAGLDAVYVPLPAVDAEDFIRLAVRLDIEGASVTIPFKQTLLERLDDVDQIGRTIGAVNTIRVVNGRWVGTNTDMAGFLKPLIDRGFSLRDCRVSILGAGGSARAVALGLALEGASVTVHARNPDRAAQVAALARGRTESFPPEPGTWDLLVNCTPVGMHPLTSESPLDSEGLEGPPGRLVYDLVYNPQITRLLANAAAAGCHTIGGLDMLVAQAQEQFRWWTGINPEPGVMRQAALARLAEFATDANHVV